jgi:hypothetical protein
MIFLAYSTWAQRQADEDRHQILVTVDQQNRQVACLAASSQTYEQAVAELLVAQHNYPDADVDFIAGRLAQIRDQLAQSRQGCLPGPDPTPPAGTLPPPTRTTTTRTTVTFLTTSTFR